MRLRRTCVLLGALPALIAGVCVAQFRGRGGRGMYGDGGDTGPFIRTEGGVLVNEDTVRTARETVSHSTGTPDWTNAPGFEKDVFTFTRIIYKQTANPRVRRVPGPLRWVNDFPDSDLNLSFRLQQLTSLKADPDGRVLKLTDPALFDYPWIYMVKPGGMELRDEEVPILRKYLLNGGVLMADDFWGDSEWNNFESQIKRVLPEREWQELPLSHPIFHCVFDLNVSDKNKLQVPSIHRWERTQNPDSGMYGSFNARRGDGDPNMHVRAWFDDKGRIMVIATHNTDNGDGWEREGENRVYFETFSETRAYPLGINIIFYLMTH
jgi:hypothetical protein